MVTSSKRQAWQLDQHAKSLFFLEKLHDWGLISVAKEIERVPGEALKWQLDKLGISDVAWNRIIHSGIKPIIVFANPEVLASVDRSVSYYRMLAMVSQKSMQQIGLSTTRFEKIGKLPEFATAEKISFHLNMLISNLVESDDDVVRREFDIWRGMAAGSQAQGSWQNRKGDQAEYRLRQHVVDQLKHKDLLSSDEFVNVYRRSFELELRDGRTLKMGSEPDLVIYTDGRIQAAVEVKGGIDNAGVLERVGAAIKSLRRAKEESPGAITILVISGVSMSLQAQDDIESSKFSVNYWFTTEDIVQNGQRKLEFYRLLGLA